jgi:hypothetical protein
MSKMKIEEMLENSQQKYDDAKKPIIIDKIRNKFRVAKTNEEEVILELKQLNLKNEYQFEKFDVDLLIEAELAIEDQQRKLEKIKTKYKDWYGEEL